MRIDTAGASREHVEKEALKVVAILSQLSDLEYRDLRIEVTEHGYVRRVR